MAEQPWFKFFAADYLLDPDVDALPREAEALLVRMWCICHREGSCPADVESLARKTLCGSGYVSQYKPQCEQFFELRDGRLYSRRMEAEKQRSEQARKNANIRYGQKPRARAKSKSESKSESESESERGTAVGSANGSANGSAVCSAARARSTQFPESFRPNEEHQTLARELGIGNLENCFAAFRDNHLAKGSTFKDWDKAFDTWLRREPSFTRHGGTNGNGENRQTRLLAEHDKAIRSLAD